MRNMDPGLALSAVEYAVQLAQHIKHTVTTYHENSAQYENLISRFRTIRKSLWIIKESNHIDFRSPIWGNAFRRIRDEFEKFASVLKELDHAIRSSPLRRFFHAKETNRKIAQLEVKVDALQSDLDLLGFFTFSNAANAQQSDVLVHNIRDVKASLIALEARLLSLEQKLQAQNSHNSDCDSSLSGRQSQDNEDFRERQAHLTDKVRTLYQREIENPRQRSNILVDISKLQADVRRHAATLMETYPSDKKSTLLSEACEKLLSQWCIDQNDIYVQSSNQMHHTKRSIVCEGSVKIRGLWKYPVREARVAVKSVFDSKDKSSFSVLIQRIVALREVNHPNLVSFYGAYWPNEGDQRNDSSSFKNRSIPYPLLVAELMTHNLAQAVRLKALSTTDAKLKVLVDVSRGVEYLHRRGAFRIALTTKHVMLRIRHGEVIGNTKLSSLWSSHENKRGTEESLYEDIDVLHSRAPIYYEDTFKFGLLMCFLLSSKVDYSVWDDGVFAKVGLTDETEKVKELARIWVRGIEPPFLKEVAKRCLFTDKRRGPSIKFIRTCVEQFLNNESLPDLSTRDCGEGIRRKGKNIFYGKQGSLASPENAIRFFERAVICGNVAALVNLGNCYFYGLGTKRDTKLGFELFQAAAFAGNAAGQVKLGVCYHSGIPGITSTDILLAVEMYRRAAIQGDASAQFKLGCYKCNEEIGNPRHREEAAMILTLAASGGHRYAQFFVGRCFEEGIGFKKDIAAAQIWYGRSAAQGHFGGKWALQRLSDAKPVKPPPLREQQIAETGI